MRLSIARRATMCVVLACLVLTGAPGARPPQPTKTANDAPPTALGPPGLALGSLSRAVALAAATDDDTPRALYAYSCTDQVERTTMLAGDVKGSDVSGARPGETIGEVGRRHFQDLIGDWKMTIWVLETVDKRINATGKARVIQADDDALRIVYDEIETPSDEDRLHGYSLLRYERGRGFALRNRFGDDGADAYFTGEYVVDKNAYDFYGTTAPPADTTDVIHSAVRIELRLASSNLWVAETYTLIDGKEVQVQLYRFERS